MVENIFESFKIIVKGKVYWTRVKEVTGWNPDFMEEEDTQTESDNATIQSESDERESETEFRMKRLPNMKCIVGDRSQTADTLKYPPGFTPNNTTEVNSNHDLPPNINSGENTMSQEDVVSNKPNHKPKLSDKKVLWDYLHFIIDNWAGEVVIMGDFNEVRTQDERFGSIFNIQGAAIFNSFISSSGLSMFLWEGCSLHGTIDAGYANSDLLNNRKNVMTSLLDMEKIKSLEVAQKAKIKWSIEGDEKFEILMFKSIWKKDVSLEELKRAVWDCGMDKSLGPDGFTFGFYRRYWSLLEKDVIEAVSYFFQHGSFPKGGNSSFIALIPKSQNANMVKDFRPISLIGSLYKIIAKIMVNRLVSVLEDIVSDVQSAFVAGMFKGVSIGSNLHLSHLFYADDVVFLGQWSNSNISTIIKVLKCFFCASGLSINMHKSKLMRIAVDDDIVNQAWLIQIVPSQVLKRMESIRSRFFNGVDIMEKKLSFITMHGKDGNLSTTAKPSFPSIWLDIIRELHNLKNKGIDLLGFIKKKIGNGVDTLFWEDTWKGDIAFKFLYPRIYKLETCKHINVASKLVHDNVRLSLRRMPRGGVELEQFTDMINSLADFQLPNMQERWYWSLSGSGDFSVASVRKIIDDHLLPEVSSKFSWRKMVPIKNHAESSSHLFFACSMARDIFRNITSWWDVKSPHVSSFEEWEMWTSSLTLSLRRKHILE
ncbi:hypothetical protein Tco_1051086, partial [Tanacetum coccineum]